MNCLGNGWETSTRRLYIKDSIITFQILLKLVNAFLMRILYQLNRMMCFTTLIQDFQNHLFEPVDRETFCGESP